MLLCVVCVFRHSLTAFFCLRTHAATALLEKFRFKNSNNNNKDKADVERMAFFGLTMMGTQSCFNTALAEAMDLSLFTEDEFRRSFSKLDKDGSGFIEVDELSALLEDVFHGPAPESQVRALLARFDSNSDGRVSWEEFRTGVKALQDEMEGKELEKDAKYASAEELRATRRKHTREAKGPKDTLAVPLTTGQEVGWTLEEAAAMPQKRLPKKRCEETKYADELVKAGVFF